MVPEGWQEVQLGDLFDSSREKGEPGLPTMSVTLNEGLVLRESLERKTDTNLAPEEHLRLRKGYLAYNMMRMWQGASGLAPGDALVSPAYVVLKPRPTVDPLFASYFFKAARTIYLFWAYSYGLTKDRLRLYFPDFSLIPAAVPPIGEQRRIGEILSTWDCAIETVERLIENGETRKAGLMQQLLGGAARGDFCVGEWKLGSFSDLFVVANKKSAQVKSVDYQDEGATPIVDQGKALVAGWTDETETYTDVPVIVFGDHTKVVKWVDFSFAPGADGTQVLKTKPLIGSRFGYFLLANADLPDLGYSRHMRELKNTEFRYPVDPAEQQRITAILSAAEASCSLLQSNRDSLEREKSALMQQLLTGKRRVRVDGDVDGILAEAAAHG